MLRCHKPKFPCLSEGASAAVQRGVELLGKEAYDIPATGLDWHGASQQNARRLATGQQVVSGLGVISGAAIAAQLLQ